HHTVALHDVPRHADIALVGRVGDDQPAIGLSVGIGLAHRVVVITGNAAHFRAVACNHVHATLTHGRVDVDDATRAEQARPPGDRATVVAVGRASDCDCRGDVLVFPGENFARVGAPPGLLLDCLLQQPQHRIGATQGLETSEPET